MVYRGLQIRRPSRGKLWLDVARVLEERLLIIPFPDHRARTPQENVEHNSETSLSRKALGLPGCAAPAAILTGPLAHSSTEESKAFGPC